MGEKEREREREREREKKRAEKTGDKRPVDHRVHVDTLISK